jgi:CRP-like cAMP-binding protein
VQYLIYCKLFLRLFATAAPFAAKPVRDKLKDRIGIRNVGLQVCLDQFVYHPLMYFPVFYMCQEVINSGASSPIEMFKKALHKYRGNMLDDLKALWKIYIPVSIIQCSVVPVHLRVPFVATVGIFWCAILSYMRGEDALAQMDAAVKKIVTIDPKELSQKLEQAHLALPSTGMDHNDFAQFLAEVGITEAAGMSPEMLINLFEVMDVDGNGVITTDELRTCINVLAGRGTPEERKAFVLSNLEFCREPSKEPLGSFDCEFEFDFLKKRQPPDNSKTYKQKEWLTTLLKQAPLFSEIDDKDMEAVLNAMKRRTFAPGTTVFTEGDMGESLYIVEAGRLDRVKSINGQQKTVKTLAPGDLFGESVLVDFCPRVTSVVSHDQCVCWQLDRETVLHAVKDSAVKRRNKFIAVLSSTLPDINVLETETFKKGDKIIRQGPIGDKFYLVEEGCLVALRKDSQNRISRLTTYGPGDYFGENALLKHQSRPASIIVESDSAKVLSMSREAFDQLEMPHFLSKETAALYL